MNRRPTIRDIAKIVGFSHSTVSEALRDHPSIPEKTREKIRKVADQIGYRFDPMLSALSSYRWKGYQPSHQGTLAWLVDARNEKDYRRKVDYSRILIQVRERASQLGYRI